MSKVQSGHALSSDGSKLKPRFVVMSDFGGAYLWLNRGLSQGLMTDELMSASVKLDRRVSKHLHDEFKTWQRDFEDAFQILVSGGVFDWVKFHTEGITLAVKLKQELGDNATVYYEKPHEDPNCKLNEVREVLLDGQLI